MKVFNEDRCQICKKKMFIAMIDGSQREGPYFCSRKKCRMQRPFFALTTSEQNEAKQRYNRR